MSKAAKKAKRESGGGSWRGFFRLLPKLHLPWFWIALAFACNMLYNQVMLKLPGTTAGLLSGSLDNKVLMDAVWFYVLFTIVLCADIALRSPAQHIAARNARRAVWKKMLHIRMDYYDEHNPSDLMSTITNDTTTGMQLLVGFLVGFIPGLYYVIQALREISSYNIWLMVSVFLLLPIKILYMIFVGRWQYKTQAGVYRQIGGLTAYLAERVRNLTLIKTYTNEKQELENGEKAARKLFVANMQVKKLECGVTALTTLIGLAQVMIVMVFGIVMLKKGAITIQQWVAFYMFSGTLSNSFSTLIGYWTDLKTIQGTLARTSELVMAPVEDETKGRAKAEKQVTVSEEDAPEVQTKAPQRGDIVFDHVSFSYGAKQALKDVSFTVPAGTSTAIVGLCGSGKTTSISLLEHFYEPTEGEVRLDGVPVQQLSLEELRGQLGYVQQGADIFSGTAREALTYGLHRQVSDQEIMEAARRSGFADLIKTWDKGLDTPIAAGGTSLSGGQRQRLVLTREFMRKAEVLLLDEPTSALDAAASKLVQEAIFSMFPDRTKIIITHDLSLIEQVDQIVVLNEGALAGCGTYEQLKERCSVFRELAAAGQVKGKAVQA